MATFSEPVQAGTGNITIKRTSDDVAAATIDVTDTNQVSFASDTVTINPTADLASLTEYYVQIDATAITDLGANPYAGIVDPDTTSWSFTTADATLPTLLSTSPADNATGVALGADLVATFSEPVQAGTGNITIKRTSDDVAVATIDVTDTNQVSFASDTVTINPTADLASLTEYYVQIDATAITDLGANPYAGIVDPDTTSWSFTTADATLPTLLSTSPADNATGVAVGADLVATFSEPVQAGTGNITIKRTSDDVAVATIDVTDTNQVSFASDTVTINPTADLASLTEYYVQIDATAITDLGANPYAGIVDPDTTSWSFTTADATLPTLLSSSPADNATGVALGADLVATFSEPVQAGTGNITIKRTSDDVAVATIDVTDTNQVSFASDTVTINPTADLASLTEYYVQIDARAITDLGANPYAGIVDPDTTSWSFTTADATNTAPVLIDTMVTLADVAEDAGAPVGAVGTLLSSIADLTGGGGQNNITDPDSGALAGLAITAAQTTNGSWHFSTDGGTNWNALGAVANNNARLLSADANTRVYFQPTAGFSGTVASALTFRAWDQTTGVQRQPGRHHHQRRHLRLQYGHRHRLHHRQYG